MANAKNTIQNIPLTGSLNLNTLKTDVSQFEGYNEKNSTVFGGELSPFYKTSDDFNLQFNSDDTIPLLTDSGDIRFLRYKPYAASFPVAPGADILDKNGNVIYNGRLAIPVINEFKVPSDALWATQLYCMYGLLQVYITKDALYWRGITDQFQGHEPGITNMVTVDYVINPSKYLDSLPWNKINNDYSRLSSSTAITAQCYRHHNDMRLFLVYAANSDTNTLVEYDSLAFTSDYTPDYSTLVFKLLWSNFQKKYIPNESTTASSMVSIIGAQSGNGKIYFFKNTGKMKDVPKVYQASFSPGTGLYASEFSITTSYIVGLPFRQVLAYSNQNSFFMAGRTATFADILNHGEIKARTFNVTPYYLDKCNFSEENMECAAWNVLARGLANSAAATAEVLDTGHDGNGYIPRYINIYGTNQTYGNPEESECGTSFSMLDNNIVSLNFCGVPVTQPNAANLDKNLVTFITDDASMGYSYKLNGKWYSFTGILYLTGYQGKISELLKRCVVNGNYVMFLSPLWDHQNVRNDQNTVYNINNDSIITNINKLGYVPETIPHGSTVFAGLKTTTTVSASGYNAGYENNPNNPFIGYLANPIVLTYVPDFGINIFRPNLGDFYSDNIQIYMSSGDTVQSAKYAGDDPKYKGTIYPIDSVGNIIYPFCLHSQIIKGYFNNSMILCNDDSGFPLIYYNNNILKFGYYALANMYNIKGIFTIQTAQYAFDDNNIYSIVFNNGIISNASTTAYKKNMDYIGTLPTRAIFYSKLNKTFYQFTGDAILSKIFEASDIDEIYNVQQNPSTLSIWISTNKGIYIISDTDMFKLDYTNVSFEFLKNRILFFLNKDVNRVNKLVSETISFYPLNDTSEVIPIKFSTKFYGLGAEQKASYDCWYIRLHANDRRAGYLDLKVHTITNISKETETKRFNINVSDYDENNIIYIKYQPKYQSAVAMQIEAETNLAIYQVSLGVNANDTVAQMSKNNF